MERTISSSTVIVIALLVGLLGGAAGGWLVNSYLQPPETGDDTPITRQRTINLKTEGDAIPKAVDRAEESVVKIVTVKDQPGGMPWDFFSRPRPVRGLGSGFIFEFEGETYVMTNAHVAQGARKMQIELTGGQKMEGELIAADTQSDLAVVRPVNPPEDLKTLSLGNSDETNVGEWVIAMGNPFGFQGTVTVGVVSAKGVRQVPNGQRYVLQTDAPINSGNSGGPLVNLAGEVVGVNYAIFSPNQERTTVGIGFAIPVNEARTVAHFLIHGGPWLGIGDLMPNSPGFAQWAGLGTDKGTVIMQVARQSPAAEAGLRPRDVILSVDGETIKSRDQYRQVVLQHDIGDTITFKINRGGEELTVQVEAGRIPGWEGE
jgi:S1-C subfamily serine protease